MTPIYSKILQLEPQEAYVDGHFDGNPIVPGAVSLNWMIQILQAFLGKATLESFRIRNFKCLRELSPFGEVEIRVFGGNNCIYSIQLLKEEQLIVTTDVLLQS